MTDAHMPSGDTEPAEPMIRSSDHRSRPVGDEDLPVIDSLEALTDIVEDSALAFLYQAHKASGEDSTFFKLVSR